MTTICFPFILMLISVMFVYSSMPLVLSLLVISQVVSISLAMALTNPSSWHSYILSMVYLSGMMVIFVYFSSLSSNTLSYNNPTYLFSSFSTLISLILFTTLTYSPLTFLLSPQSMKKTLFKLYISPNLSISLFMMTYLLLVLIIVVNNVSMAKGPMKT